jgi:hypothetical protein
MQALMLFLHIAIAIGVFGCVVAFGRLFLSFKDRPKEEALGPFRLAHRIEKIAGPATILVPLIGIGLVFSSNDACEFSQVWVWLSLVLYLAGAALGPGAAAKAEESIIAKLEAAPAGATAASVAPDEVQRLRILELVLWESSRPSWCSWCSARAAPPRPSPTTPEGAPPGRPGLRPPAVRFTDPRRPAPSSLGRPSRPRQSRSFGR